MFFRNPRKKGEFSLGYVISAILAVVVIVVVSYFAYKYFTGADDTIDGVCPGTCKRSCNLLNGDVQKSATCKKEDGTEDKERKCCVNAKDKPKDDSGGSGGGGTINVPDSDVIEVRLNDDMNTRIGLDQSIVLMELQKEYKLSVWGWGPKGGKTCEIKFLDKDGNTPSTGFLSGKNKKQDCVDANVKTNAYNPDRKNILVVDNIVPKGGEVGDYKFNVYFYDKDGTAVASYGIPIKVTEPIPLADELCQYDSCEKVPDHLCLNTGVPKCPDLTCRLELGQIDVDTGVKAPNKCLEI